MGRSSLKNFGASAVYGFDIWNCYEISWLSPGGKPEVRIGEIVVPCSSPNIVESKSLKLYFNSFNDTKFQKEADVVATIRKDLGEVLKSEILVSLKKLSAYAGNPIDSFQGTHIDLEDIEIGGAAYDPFVLEKGEEYLSENLYSDLLKSNCPVTGQPDWASLLISYEGLKILRPSLLKYIISLRNSEEFHEQCVERIFCDIKERLSPEKLLVYARYTRRGGIDINPVRSDYPIKIEEINYSRLARQ